MTMKKKQYMKPEQRVVELHHMNQLLAGSLRSVKSSGIDSEDEFEIEDEVGSGFWGR